MARRRSSHRSRRQKCQSNANKKFCLTLRRLLKLKPSHRCEAMKLANNAFIRKMCTEIRKVRYMTLNIKKANAIARHGKVLRTLSNPKTSIPTKRKLLSQRGGFLPLLAPIIMAAAGPALGGLAGALANKAING